jgi:hypothetical protein
MRASKHVASIIEQHNRTANLQVVFTDIESYSKRRTLNQIAVIDGFTTSLKQALNEVAKKFVDYAQSNNLNFKTDIITLPTGDGAAVIFSFDGLDDVHLCLARELLKAIYEMRSKAACAVFSEQGWCNCHAHFNVRIGISEGKGIIYEDVNENYNVAGNAINMASRVMGFGDRNQIVFTEEAYRQIIDMTTDSAFLNQFVRFDEVPIKHGLKISAYQYISDNEAFLNSNPPTKLLMMKKIQENMDRMKSLGFPLAFGERDPTSTLAAVDSLDTMTKLFETIVKGSEPPLKSASPPLQDKVTPESPASCDRL